MSNLTPEPEHGNEYINSVIRATNILELFVKLDVQYLGVVDISRELGLHKTTAFRVVKTLEHQGWLRQDTPNGKYKLGSKLITLASAVTRNFSVDDLILQEMRNLRDEYNEDVVLTGLVDDVAVCMEKVQSKNILRIHSRVGRTSTMLKGSTGKTLLAYQPLDKIQSVLDNSFSQSPQDQQARAKLEADLEQIRRDGFCTTTSEQDQGITSITVPVFNCNGKVVYSLAILGEEHRMLQKGPDNMLNSLRHSAARIEDDMRLV